MRKKIMITMMLSFFMYTGYAQNEESVISENVILQEDTLSQETSNPIMTAFTDSLNQLKASFYAYFRVWEDLNIPVPRHIRMKPEYYKLFIPHGYFRDGEYSCAVQISSNRGIVLAISDSVSFTKSSY